MIYTEGSSILNKHLEVKNFDHLTFESHNIYVFSRTLNAINDDLVKNIKQNNTLKFVIVNNDVPHVSGMAQYTLDIIEKYNLPQNQIFYVCEDKLAAKMCKEHFRVKGFPDIHVDGFNMFNFLLDEKLILDKKPTKSLSIFSRTFKPWRLRFFVDLVERGLLDDAVYSFCNGSYPYPSKLLKISNEEVINYLSILNSKSILIESWIRNIPYQIGRSLTFNDHDLNIAIQESFFHVVLETSLGHLADCTEKTYRPIWCKRPFIVYGAYEALGYLHTRGFKTFHPIINEDYNFINDDQKRKEAILVEIERLCSMTNIEKEDFIAQCRPILEHNYNVIMNMKYQPLTPEFKQLEIFNHIS